MSMETPKSAGTFCFSHGHLNQSYRPDLFSVSQDKKNQILMLSKPVRKNSSQQFVDILRRHFRVKIRKCYLFHYFRLQ